MELKKYKLGEIAEIIGGVAYTPADVCDKGIRILRGGNIQSQNIVFNNSDVFLPEKYRDSKNQILEGDTIIVASTGSVEVLGKAATCFTVMPNTQIGAFMRIVRPKQKKYAMLISIALNSPHFSKYIKSQAKGTSINNINIGHLNNYDILVSDKTDISYLSSIYENIESKIALCRATNKTLEAMAKQLYDYWFVQFDFPNENGKPYKTNGGKMVYNPQLKREVPEGWEVKSVGELLPIVTGKEDANFSTPNGKYKFFTCSKEILTCDTPAFKGSAVLLSGNGDIHTKFYDGEFNAYQRTYVLIPTNPLHFSITYFACSNEVQQLLKGSCGSIIKFITKSMIENIFVVIPPNEFLLKQLNDILYLILNNHREISTLTTLRDSLLPLLMNGQVVVGA